MKVTSLYVCPWSLFDPLCQSQCLAYLFELSKSGYTFALITFENPRFAVSPTRFDIIRQELKSKGVYWYPVKYSQGLSLPAKAFSNINGFITGARVCRKHNPSFIHSRSSLTTMVAVLLSKVFRRKFLYDADSVLSEEYVDIGYWSRESRGFKLLAKSEEIARKSATQMILLTERLKRDFQDKYEIKIPINIIPCCVNTDKFQFDPVNRNKIRNELGLTNEKVFVYVGKIGSWYMVEEIFDFFKAAQSKVNGSKLLIVTNDLPEKFEKIAQDKEIDKDFFLIVNAKADEVTEYLSASDVGLAFIKSLPSKRGSSPVKVPEYLANGLPTVITDNIGDCSNLVTKERVGVVLASMSDHSYKEALDKLERLWADEKDLHQRCKKIAEDNFSLEKVGAVSYGKIYRQVLTDNS